MNYERAEIYPINTILPLLSEPIYQQNYKERWCENKKQRNLIELNGDFISVNSVRLYTYKIHGVKCKFCGLEGTFFAKERQKSKTGNPHGKWHLNLYAIDENNYEIMITSDHIIPKSKGGSEQIENRQPLCMKCNLKKGNKMSDSALSEIIVKWCDNLFDNMMTRPGMYAGEMDQRGMESMEMLCIQLLEFRCLAKNQEILKNGRFVLDKYRNFIKKYKSGSARLASVCDSELDFIIKMRNAWKEVISE